MVDQQALLDYLSSSEGINTIIAGIIIIGAINAIFITFSVRTTYGAVKKEKDRRVMQQKKIDKLYPKQE